MTIKYSLLTIVLTISLTLSIFGQSAPNDMSKTDMKKHDMSAMHDMSSMMGKPTVDATFEGLHMKVWLMTQKAHKKMMKGKMGEMMMDHNKMGMKDTGMDMGKDMKGMKHDGMEMDKATKEAMMAGTHHIMLDVTDATSGNEIADASAKLLIVSPSKKNSSIDLKPVMTHFGNGIALSEKGEYQFTVNINMGGASKTKQFQYTVK